MATNPTDTSIPVLQPIAETVRQLDPDVWAGLKCGACGTELVHGRSHTCPPSEMPPSPFVVEIDGALAAVVVEMALRRAGLKLVNRGENRPYLLTSVGLQSTLNSRYGEDYAHDVVNAEATRIRNERLGRGHCKRATQHGREILLRDDKRIEKWPTERRASERLSELERAGYVIGAVRDGSAIGYDDSLDCTRVDGASV